MGYLISMKTTASAIKTRRKQLDRKLREYVDLRDTSVPSGGWIFQVRSSLGMSSEALGNRMGISKSAAAKLERSEAKQTISLKSLQNAAQALNCELVYALRPKVSLEEILRSQAEVVARRIVQNVQKTMGLEEQGSSKIEIEDQIKDIVDDFVLSLNSSLWKEQ